MVDIAEHKKIEKDIRRLATVVTDSNDAITVQDFEGQITAWNRGAERMYGWSQAEALKMNIRDIVPGDKEEESLRFVKAIEEEEEEEEVTSFETKRITKDGRILDVWLTVTKLVDDTGKAMAVATTERDITERKRMQEQMVRSEKLAAIGKLAGIMGHEIRNPLGVIRNSIYFLNMKLTESMDEKVKKHLDILQTEINNCDKIISDVLGFTSIKAPLLAEYDINYLVEKTIPKAAIPKSVKVQTDLGENLPKVLVDISQMEQVFSNMISNAVQAMPEGGELKIATNQADSSIVVAFRDTGCGISEKSLDKIFEPLFSTKVKGIGLGLTTCQIIVEGHQGKIEVQSEANKGATFTVKLPVT